MGSVQLSRRSLLLFFRPGRLRTLSKCFFATGKAEESEPVWRDPFKHAQPEKPKTVTEFEEFPVDWKNIERLMPHRVIPEVPKHESYPTPSGWSPPCTSSDLPYFVSRRRNHTFPLYLQARRDQLDPKTMDFTYVELVQMKNVSGDVFACAQDLQAFLEAELGHPVATNVDELKGIITVKGADRSLLEKFLYKAGF